MGMRSLLSALFPLLFSLSIAQQTTPRRLIIFSDADPLFPIYERYDAAGLSAGASIQKGPPSVPFQFRSFVKAPRSFTYTTSVAPGKYTLAFGFYEFSKCASNARVFTISANGKTTPNINVFAAKGCNQKHFVRLFNVKAYDGKLTLNAKAVQGGPPFLASLQLVKTGDAPTSTKPPSTSSNVLASIVFSKGVVPAGWTRYQPNRLSAGTDIINSRITSLRLPFRSYARSSGGFTYFQPLPPGTYTIVMGFAETFNPACKVGKRVFKVSLNGKMTKEIDIFKAVGCNKPFSRRARFTLTSTQRRLNIRLVPVKGFVPVLSNFRIVSISGGTTTRTEPPSVTSPVSFTTISASTPTSGGGAKVVVLDADMGSASDPEDSITGNTKVFTSIVPIEGTTRNARFSRHRFGMEFSYIISVKPGVTYGISLDFAESFEPGCKDGFREFDVAVYDSNKGVSAGKMIKSIKLFEEAGCRAALRKTLTGISVGPSGSITIKFMSVQNNALISAFQIFTTDPKFGTAPQPPSVSKTLKDSVEIDVGSGAPSDIDLAGTKKTSTTKAIMRTTSITQKQLQTNRFGADFTYKFNLNPGAYDIVLGFSENFNSFCAEPGKRVFNVYVNDLIQLEAVDIFAQVGCFKGMEVVLKRQTVGAVDIQPLTLRFAAIVNNAQINYIKVMESANECVPASATGQLSADHAAHAVPGSYPPQNTANAAKSYVDTAGSGFFRVTIDGGKSHTHFFDPAKNIVGRVTSYTWTIVETNKVISRQETFSYNFPLGTTRLKLAVTDNSCTSDEAETTVTVTGKIQPGAYCYYYQGLDDLPKAGSEAGSETPQFAKVSPTLQFGFPDFPFKDSKFGARCTFFLEVDKASMTNDISVSTFGSGRARVYKGQDLLIDSDASPVATTGLAVGLIGFEIVYLRTNLNKAPKLDFFVNDKIPGAAKVTHDRTTVLPVLTSVSPNDGPVGGGTNVKVSGFGLFPPLTVKFGGKTVATSPFGQNQNQFFVTAPAVSSASTVPIVVTSAAGVKSNPIFFQYGSSCDNVKFTEQMMKNPDGSDTDPKLPTSAAIGQDGRIYMGTLGGTVQVLEYNMNTFKTISRCQSKPLTHNKFKKDGKLSRRYILGLTFDPRDKVDRPYITTSTYDWWDKDDIDRSNKQAWQNGAVDRLKPGTDPSDPSICLVFDKRIVNNLPVSNHDHSVNGLIFAQNGDLMIAVGGNTNLGLPGYKLGGFWETHLSAAILVAKLSKPGFDGEVKYSNPTKLRLAKRISGDVDPYVTGLRNTFCLAMTSSGDVYAADNGPNCSFGDTATSCSDYVEAEAEAWQWDNGMNWKGKVMHGGSSSCPFGLGRPDKVVHITKGSYYGHPNLNRQECEWIDPFDDLTAENKPAPAYLNYKPPMETMQSPLTGIAEYRAGHFCSKLKGDLILSAYKNGKTFRMGVDGGKKTSGPDQISPNGGITFVENSRGDLIFPRLSEKDIFVLRPKISAQTGLYISGAIPFRHGKNGGTTITVSGFNFGPNPKVSIGSKSCQILSKSNTDIKCKVPPHTQGAKNIQVVAGSESATLQKAVLYMQV